MPPTSGKSSGPPFYTDAVSEAVFLYLRTGVLPATDLDIPIPGPDTGPGRGMTGCITSAHIKQYAKDWYIGMDGELHKNGEGPGPVPSGRDAPHGSEVLNKVKKMVGVQPKEKEAFFDWND